MNLYSNVTYVNNAYIFPFDSTTVLDNNSKFFRIYDGELLTIMEDGEVILKLYGPDNLLRITFKTKSLVEISWYTINHVKEVQNY